MQEIKRALFIYAKLNPGIKYVQGMNEIYAPIYYQFATDTNTDAAMHAEADAFFCFVELISEFRDHFCQHLVSEQFVSNCLPNCQVLLSYSCISILAYRQARYVAKDAQRAGQQCCWHQGHNC